MMKDQMLSVLPVVNEIDNSALESQSGPTVMAVATGKINTQVWEIRSKAEN